jgi:SAM-dependent methyltransferase
VECPGEASSSWWAEERFWEDMFDFIFPPEHLALGEPLAAKAVALLGLAPGAAILDMGCGPGRVAIPLARRGHRVVGVDAQPGYLERARAWAEREGLALDLVRADMAELELDAAFDAAICAFTSFGYFAERRRDLRVLERARAALRPGGRFLLETAHRDGVVRLMPVQEARLADGRAFRSVPRFEPVSGVLELTWTVTSPAGPTRAYRTRLRPYSATELDEMLREVGFREVALFGDLERGAPSIESYTIVAVGTR